MTDTAKQEATPETVCKIVDDGDWCETHKRPSNLCPQPKPAVPAQSAPTPAPDWERELFKYIWVTDGQLLCNPEQIANIIERIRNEGRDSVLYIRCMKHRGGPQYNKDEHGQECAECAVQAAAIPPTSAPGSEGGVTADYKTMWLKAVDNGLAQHIRMAREKGELITQITDLKRQLEEADSSWQRKGRIAAFHLAMDAVSRMVVGPEESANQAAVRVIRALAKESK